MPFGFIGRENNESKAIRNIVEKKISNTTRGASEKERIKAIERKAYAKEYERLLKSKARQKAKQQLRLNPGRSRDISLTQGLGSQLKSIGKRYGRKELPRQENYEDDGNLFSHKSEKYVYGDEGLTFFDSNKSRGNGRTGSLFGI